MRLISILLLLFSLLFGKSEGYISINFKDLKINDFVKMASKITGKNILLNYNIPGKVNFISVKPVKKDQIYNLLINILKNRGYTLVDSYSGFLKVVRSSEASRESPPLNGKNNEIAQVQTDIVGIKNISASKILLQTRFLLSRYGKMIVSKETNALVITDYPQNLKTIERLIKRIDSKIKKEILFYTLKNSKVASVLPKIKGISISLYDQRVPSQKVDIFADNATNTIILISNKKILKNLTDYIKRLDKKDNISKKVLHIVRLKNSDAKMISSTLKKIISTKPGPKKIVHNKKIPTFTADKETNTLIIYASNEEFEEIEKLINALDIPRQQVYVTAKIVEISDLRSKEIGAKYGILGGISNSSGLYSFSSSLGSPAIPFNLNTLGIDPPSLKRGIALGATISLLSTNGAANIMSQPTLLCVNNLESTIYVGKTESIITQASVNASTTDVTKNVYTRQDIGLTLKVKPRISSDNKVLLNVKVILEDVVPGSIQGLPITTKRDVETTAIVKNGESIIIGGLVKENNSKKVTKVPLLGDIPLFGQIFRHKESSNDKVNLVVLLTPYIVKNSIDLSKIREMLAKLNDIENRYAKEISKRLVK